MQPVWAPSDIPSQHGRRAIVTGGNNGIGFPTALELARHGATVIVASRNPEKGLAAVDRIRKEAPGADVSFAEIDLASLESVRRFAARQLALDRPLDLLINNAGIYAPPQRLETADHFELQFGTNVLGPFALTALLFPALLRAGQDSNVPPRVVWVASVAHKRGQLRFADLQFHGDYNASAAYRQSKLADLMLALEMDRRLRARNLHVLSDAAHPGVSGTGLFQTAHFPAWQLPLRRASAVFLNAVLNNVQAGALPTLYAATASSAQGGGYYGPQGFAEIRGGDVGPAIIEPHARDVAAARHLWSVCEELTGCSLLSD